MTPEQVREIFREELIRILGDYSNVPLEVRNALALILPGLLGTGTGTAATQVIDTSGSTANVPAQPSGTLKATFQGVEYELLYK